MWVLVGSVASVAFFLLVLISSLGIEVSGRMTWVFMNPPATILLKMGMKDTDPFLIYYLVAGGIWNFGLGSIVGVLCSIVAKRYFAKNSTASGTNNRA